jgi:hypothetical protein
VVTPTEDVEALRAATREAHEVLKDLRAERRAITQLLDGIGRRVDDRIKAAVKDGLAALGIAVDDQMRKSVAKFTAEFDRLEAIVLGTDPKSRRTGRPPLAEVLRAGEPR